MDVMKTKKVIVAAVILSVLTLCRTSHAVILKKGWWVAYGECAILNSDPSGIAYWSPACPEAVPLSDFYGIDPYGKKSRRLNIYSDIDVAPGVIHEDVGAIAYDPSTNKYNEVIYGMWYTNYESDKIRLQLYKRRGLVETLIWEQTKSGPAMGPSIAEKPCDIVIGDQLVFKITVVPEPSSIFGLAAGLLPLAAIAGRRIRRPETSFVKGCRI